MSLAYASVSSVTRRPSSSDEDDEDAPTSMSAEYIMDRLRYLVATKRIRVSEFFRDFDKLRCYSIPTQEFVRGVNRIGLTLTEKEYDTLVKTFTDPEKRGNCKWKDFEKQIERGKFCGKETAI